MLDSINGLSESDGKQSESAGASASTPETIAIPLQVVLDRFPAALKPFLTRAATADEKVMVATSRVLAQLSTGAVRITFDELRQSAPADLFNGGAEQGATLVDVPLPAILRAAGPGLLKRRSATKAEPAKGAFFAGMGPGPAPAPVPPPAAVPFQPSPLEPSPAPIVTPALTMPLPHSGLGLQPPVEFPTSSFQPPSPPNPEPRPAGGTTFFQPSLPPATPVASTAAASAPAGNRVSVSLAMLCANWPEHVRLEAGTLGEVSIEFPREELGTAMKTGRVTFTWGQLRSWITPCPGPSAHDATVVPLPLRLLVQPFMATVRGGEPAKRTAPSEGRTESFVNRAPTASLNVPVPPASVLPRHLNVVTFAIGLLGSGRA